MAQCTHVNVGLETKVATLEQTNKTLLEQLEDLRRLVYGGSGGGSVRSGGDKPSNHVLPQHDDVNKRVDSDAHSSSASGTTGATVLMMVAVCMGIQFGNVPGGGGSSANTSGYDNASPIVRNTMVFRSRTLQSMSSVESEPISPSHDFVEVVANTLFAGLLKPITRPIIRWDFFLVILTCCLLLVVTPRIKRWAHAVAHHPTSASTIAKSNKFLRRSLVGKTVAPYAIGKTATAQDYTAIPFPRHLSRSQPTYLSLPLSLPTYLPAYRSIIYIYICTARWCSRNRRWFIQTNTIDPSSVAVVSRVRRLFAERQRQQTVIGGMILLYVDVLKL